MANYSQNRDETGNDGTLIVKGSEIAFTSASYDGPDPDWSEVQFSDGLHNDIALTGVSYSGSFEFSGNSEDLRDALYEKADDGQYDVPVSPEDIEIRIREQTENGTRTVVFRGVGVGTRSRDLPADDRTTTSYDFVAERMYHV